MAAGDIVLGIPPCPWGGEYTRLLLGCKLLFGLLLQQNPFRICIELFHFDAEAVVVVCGYQLHGIFQLRIPERAIQLVEVTSIHFIEVHREFDGIVGLTGQVRREYELLLQHCFIVGVFKQTVVPAVHFHLRTSLAMPEILAGCWC